MRFGEMAGFHVEDLDFEESVIRIRRSTYRLEEVTPKSQAGHRQIDVDLRDHPNPANEGQLKTGQR
jgi:hypothetical protein